MIDTHCHLTYRGLVERVDAVIDAAVAAGVDRMICVGTGAEDAGKAIALAERRGEVFATAGLHPLHVEAGMDLDRELDGVYRALRHPRVVGLGEMGLDMHYNEPPIDLQRTALSAQLAIANDPLAADLPIVIHSRKSSDAVLEALDGHGVDAARCVFHCFTGTAEEAGRIVEAGACVGFTGIVTFPNAPEVAEASDVVPMDRLLIETDAPYLSPQPVRKVRPNEPKHVAHVAEFLAARRGVGVAAFTAQTDRNAERLFFRLASA
ncbi:MAG: TatD family hydrolase [Planctomycetota bacterium]